MFNLKRYVIFQKIFFVDTLWLLNCLAYLGVSLLLVIMLIVGIILLFGQNKPWNRFYASSTKTEEKLKYN